ncbi:hypothetical protein ACQR1H_03225 [Bradyrhizobium sp. HKCCYLRH2015]|uniref:hypothetical protein n=1 Tax=Bradyrhizobium sp. HKCCYLRH2015 TaxID=3420742 RepID=UPI003EBDC98A
MTVGDAFLKLSPEQQNAAVQEIAWQIGAKAAAPLPVTANEVLGAAAEGVPILGGMRNQVNAAVNATLAPFIEPHLAPSENDISRHGENWTERYAKSKQMLDDHNRQFAEQHPIVNAGSQIAGSVLSMAGPMSAAPKAFGLVGSVPQMVRNGAISGAALSGADAAVRGADPAGAAAVGGIVGGAAGPVGKGMGKVVASIADRVRPAAPIAQNVERVAGVDVPLSSSQVTQNPALSAEEQVILRGGRGEAAQASAQGFKDLQDARIAEARDKIAAGFDATGQTARTLPQDAAEQIAAELIAQEQARRSADAARVAQVGQEGQALARSLDAGGQVRAPTPYDAGEMLSERITAARDAARADYRGKYDLVGQQPGEFAPGSAAGFRNDVEAGLNNAERPVSLDPTNTPRALQGLDIIDGRMNLSGSGRPGAPTTGAEGFGAEHVQNVADIRAKFGDQVAAAYDRQKQSAAAPPSLLQFIASKGGLAPNAELEAIGLATGHREQIPGQKGFFSVVNNRGTNLDRMREAAEEAGYLRGQNGATATPRDLLDAIDAELRGQKRYPQGFEGAKTKRETALHSERAQHEQDAFMRGFEDDLAAAGHGELGPDVKNRAARLMADEGLDADTAVEHAIRQLEQEDFATPRGAGFPGDRIEAPKVSADAAQGGAGFTMRDVEQVRKQLVTLYKDARSKMMAGGSGSDVYALEHIMEQFDARVEQMVAAGKFSGDGPAVLQMQRDARAAFADYKAKFARRGSGDTVGAAVEKILGKFADTAATPDEVARLAYGSAASPGGQMPVQIAQRIASIFGRNSEEFSAFKQGLLAHLTAGEPEKAAARVNEFLTGTRGRLLAQTVFSAEERAALSAHANRLASIAPRPNEPGPAAAAIRRLTGADGAPPASPNQLVNDLFGATGKGAGRAAVPLAQELKRTLSPDGWTAVRQGMFEKLTSAGEGKIELEAQALSQRLHEFLNEGGKQLAQVLYSPQEIELMRKLASVYKQMIPVKGTTNPSGTAPMLARVASGLRQTLLPLLGLTQGGLPGAAVAVAADKGLSAVGNLNAAHNARRLFYGPQPGRQVSKGLMLASGLRAQAMIEQSNQRRRRSE